MAFRVLIVEDSEDFAELLCRILKRLGHTGYVVTNQKDARYRLEDETFDFVLLDLSLPAHKSDSNPLPFIGEELLAHIRERFNSKELPVIMMTAYERSSQTGVKLMKAGADDYFAKGDTAISPQEKIEEMVRTIERNHTLSEARQLGTPSSRKRHYVEFETQGGVRVNSIQIPDKKWVEVFQLLRRLTAQSNSGMTAEKLAKEVSVSVEPNTVTAWIRRIRDFLDAEHESRGLEIGREDIIKTVLKGRSGYQLNSELCDFSFE